MNEHPSNVSLKTTHNNVGRAGISVRDIIQVLIVIFLWALCYPLITTGLAASPPFHFATVRCVLAGFSLLIAAIVLKKSLIPDRSTWFRIIIIALTFTTLGFTGMFLAGGRVTPGLATVIGNVQPFIAAMLGYFLLTERLTRTRSMALLVGFAGIVVIASLGLFGQSLNSTPVGIGFVLLGAIGVAIGNVVLKSIAHRIDPMVAMIWILLLGAIPLAVATIIFEADENMHWDISSIINLLILSVFGTALAFLWWLDVLRRVDLNLLNAYTFLTPVFAMAIGMLFYHERLVAIEWFGVAIIFVAIFLISRPDKTEYMNPEQAPEINDV